MVQLVDQQCPDGFGIVGIAERRLPKMAEDGVHQVAEGGSTDFANVPINEPQSQFAAEVVAVGAVDVVAEGGDGDCSWGRECEWGGDGEQAVVALRYGLWSGCGAVRRGRCDVIVVGDLC